MSSSTNTLPRIALTGFADGSSYDAHRPSYPTAAVTALLTHLDIADRRAARVLDLAAGTGKFTELLAARPERYEVVAVEPHHGMRAELERKALPNVTVRNGFAADMPVADAWADAVVCAQSFHWFANSAALRSIARVLKPRGRLGLVWNIEDYNNTLEHESPHPWTLQLRKLLFYMDRSDKSATPAVRFRNEKWRDVFAKEASRYPFDAIQEEEFTWTTYLDKGALWARFKTLSQIAALSEDELEPVERTFNQALAEKGTEQDEQGRVAIRGSTLVVWLLKTT